MHELIEVAQGRRLAQLVRLAPVRAAIDERLARLRTELALRAVGPRLARLRETFEQLAAAEVARALKGKKTTLKAALSDQRVVAGLGNIYVCEALHRAALSPKRRASTLATAAGEPRPGAEALADAIQAVLKDAIARQHRYRGDDRFRVYDREGQRCPRRGCPGRRCSNSSSTPGACGP